MPGQMPQPCKHGCGRFAAEGTTRGGKPFDTCCKACGISRGAGDHDPDCNAKAEAAQSALAEANKSDASTWRRAVDEGYGAPSAAAGIRLACKYGCGRRAAPGLTKTGKPFDTCCQGCAASQGAGVHSGTCGEPLTDADLAIEERPAPPRSLSNGSFADFFGRITGGPTCMSTSADADEITVPEVTTSLFDDHSNDEASKASREDELEHPVVDPVYVPPAQMPKAPADEDVWDFDNVMPPLPPSEPDDQMSEGLHVQGGSDVDEEQLADLQSPKPQADEDGGDSSTSCTGRISRLSKRAKWGIFIVTMICSVNMLLAVILLVILVNPA